MGDEDRYWPTDFQADLLRLFSDDTQKSRDDTAEKLIDMYETADRRSSTTSQMRPGPG